MDLYFNKTINNLQRNFFDESTNKTNSAYLNNKALGKSKSSNELSTKRNEKETSIPNTYVNSWGYNKFGQLGNSCTSLKVINPNTLK